LTTLCDICGAVNALSLKFPSSEITLQGIINAYNLEVPISGPAEWRGIVFKYLPYSLYVMDLCFPEMD